jgi:hypothetical protein
MKWTVSQFVVGDEAKAMEDVVAPGADVEETSGVVGVERSEDCPGDWGGPPAVL